MSLLPEERLPMVSDGVLIRAGEKPDGSLFVDVWDGAAWVLSPGFSARAVMLARPASAEFLDAVGVPPELRGPASGSTPSTSA